jgi:hypothetical protein
MKPKRPTPQHDARQLLRQIELTRRGREHRAWLSIHCSQADLDAIVVALADRAARLQRQQDRGRRHA